MKQALKEALEAASLSQSNVARDLGVSQPRVNQLVNKKPSLWFVVELLFRYKIDLVSAYFSMHTPSRADLGATATRIHYTSGIPLDKVLDELQNNPTGLIHKVQKHD